MNNKELWNLHFKQYPLLTIQDFIKFLYQSTLGSAHLIQSVEDNYAYLLKEYESIQHDPNHILYEKISDELVRVHLEAIDENDLKVYHALFMKSVEVTSSKEQLINVFHEVKQGILDGWIPFDLYEWTNKIDEYQSKGCPAVSHSDVFRENYHPHYRLMKVEYLPYLELFHYMNQLDQPCIITIDGRSGSGKSTCAKLIADIYGYSIVHMDDFFLQKEQRTVERLKEIGGNLDYERFYEEVVLPIHNKQSFVYRIFDCGSMSIQGSKNVCFENGIVVEGCYSMHPKFNEYSDLKVFIDIPYELQKERILKRNGEFMLKRFVEEWIPKENEYFDSFKIKEKANMIIQVKGI